MWRIICSICEHTKGVQFIEGGADWSTYRREVHNAAWQWGVRQSEDDELLAGVWGKEGKLTLVSPMCGRKGLTTKLNV